MSDKIQWNFLIRNVLSTVASMILTFYNIYYTHKLVVLSRRMSMFKAKVRTKILLQALTI